MSDKQPTIVRMIGRDANLVGYHKRRRRSCWQYTDGSYLYIYPFNRNDWAA